MHQGVAAAITFKGEKGILIEIDAKSRRELVCADVSWISKFHEYEQELIQISHLVLK